MILNGVLVQSRTHLDELIKDMPNNLKQFFIDIYENKYNKT